MMKDIILNNGTILKQLRVLSPHHICSRFQSKNRNDVKIEYPSTIEKKKQVEVFNYAVMLCYCGKGYWGLQRNIKLKTIEGDVLQAMYQANLITEFNCNSPHSLDFQRASRTDRGVSALRQVFNMKLPKIVAEDPDAIPRINKFLPDQIRIFDIKKATRHFDSKNDVDYRTYSYLCPTYAFAPIDTIVNEEFRITGNILDRIRHLLNYFKGSHNYFNYTIGEKHNKARAIRQILDFECSDPFFRNGIEYVAFTIKGVSFMLHQIRIMIGTIIGLQRNAFNHETFMKTWMAYRVELPIAPGNGLLLDNIHYDNYNRWYCGDGYRQPLTWTEHQERIVQFKENQIYSAIAQEDKEGSMLNWLPILINRRWDVKDSNYRALTTFGQLFSNVIAKPKEPEEIDEDEDAKLLRIAKMDD